MKRRIRKREGAGRRHRRVRREWSRRRKAHGRKNKYGLRMSGVLAGREGKENPGKEPKVRMNKPAQELKQTQRRDAVNFGPLSKGRGKAATLEWGNFAEAVMLTQRKSRKSEGKSVGGPRGGYTGKSRKGTSKRGTYGRREATRGRLREAKKVSRTRRRRNKGLRKALKKQLGGYYGYRVTVKGPLNGARRTTRRERGLGTVPGSLKSGRIGTAEGVAKTSVGTRGVQVAYCYGM